MLEVFLPFTVMHIEQKRIDFQSEGQPFDIHFLRSQSQDGIGDHKVFLEQSFQSFP